MKDFDYNRQNDEVYAPNEYYGNKEENYSNFNSGYNTNYGYNSRSTSNYDFLNDNNRYANNHNNLYFEDSRENKMDLGSKIMIVFVLLFVIILSIIMFTLFAAKERRDMEHKEQLLSYNQKKEKENSREEKNEQIYDTSDLKDEERNNIENEISTPTSETTKENVEKEENNTNNTNDTNNMRVESEKDYAIEETGITGDYYDGTLTYSNKEYGFKCTVGNFFYELDPAYTWQSPYFSYYDCYSFAYERTGDRLDLYSIVMKDTDLYLDEIDKDIFINSLLLSLIHI